MRRVAIPVVLVLSWLAACGGKVVFDGLPGTSQGAGGAGGATSSTTESVVSTTNATMVSSTVVVGTTGSSMGCSTLMPPPGCEMCINGTCCVTASGCSANSECGQLYDCIQTCKDDYSCRTTCEQSFPAAQKDYWALFECAQGCPAKCAPLDGICDSGLSTNQASCDECLSKSCCGEADACSGGDGGTHSVQLNSCINDCNQNQTGPLCKPVLDCYMKNCAGACM